MLDTSNRIANVTVHGAQEWLVQFQTYGGFSTACGHWRDSMNFRVVL